MVLCRVCVILTVVWTRSTAFLFLPRTAPRLEDYKVDKDAVSVSGISAGAAMAMQYHLALSSRVMGLGVIAGVPYGCAGSFGVTTCMGVPSLIYTPTLISVANTASGIGTIDSTSNLKNNRVFIYHSKQDTVVNFGVGQKILEFYQHFIGYIGNIRTEFNIPSEHGVPTENYGSACSQLGSEYLMKCNYSAAFHILNHIYGGHLQAPTTSTGQAGQVLQFDQSDFFYVSTPGMYSMDTQGYVYIPSRCANKANECKLHIAFHGCKQGRKFIDDAFVRHAGYNEVGELNDIIILYPQVTSSVTNPNGCWDWWGYTGIYYGTKSGFQMTAVRRMMERILA